MARRKSNEEVMTNGGGDEPEYISVEDFAKRLGRTRNAIYRRIRDRNMPKGSVVKVYGVLKINWTAFSKVPAVEEVI